MANTYLCFALCLKIVLEAFQDILVGYRYSDVISGTDIMFSGVEHAIRKLKIGKKLRAVTCFLLKP